MVSETITLSPAAIPAAPLRHRYRLRFAKADDLRLVSHHDLMHVLERMLRRAQIPFAVTQGFHPQPKFNFASALALGVVGRHEVLEVELKQELAPDDILIRLNTHAPIGLTFTSIRALTGTKAALVRRAYYRLAIPETVTDLPERIAKFLAEPAHWVHRTRPQPKRVNIRAFIDQLAVQTDTREAHRSSLVLDAFTNLSTRGQDDASSGESLSLTMVLWVTPTGAARPDEIVSALGLSQLLTEGAVLERTDLELLDEVSEADRFVPDLAAANSAASPENPNVTAPTDERPRSSTPHALVDNPLSFDS